jgi:hypothetical protein
MLFLCALAQNPCDQSAQPSGKSAATNCLRAGRPTHGWAQHIHTPHASVEEERPCPDINFSHLEPLMAAEHFRGPLHGPKSYFKRVPPHFLGRHANFSQCRRRVYIDVGARTFEGHAPNLEPGHALPPALFRRPPLPGTRV